MSLVDAGIITQHEISPKLPDIMEISSSTSSDALMLEGIELNNSCMGGSAADVE